jgi:hypothetical protein
MKKIQLLTVAAAIVSLFSFSSAKAQYGIGGQLIWQTRGSYNSVLYSSSGSTYGIGVNGFYNISGKMRIMAALNYLAPTSKTMTSSDPNSFNENTAVNKLSGLNIPLSFVYAYTGNLNEQGFAGYAFIGLDINSYSWSNKFTPAAGSPFAPVDTSHTYTGVTPHFGIGMEVGLGDKAKFFFQAKYSVGTLLSDNLFKDEDILSSGQRPPLLPESFNPFAINISIGIRYMLKQPE